MSCEKLRQAPEVIKDDGAPLPEAFASFHQIDAEKKSKTDTAGRRKANISGPEVIEADHFPMPIDCGLGSVSRGSKSKFDSGTASHLRKDNISRPLKFTGYSLQDERMAPPSNSELRIHAMKQPGRSRSPDARSPALIQANLITSRQLNHSALNAQAPALPENNQQHGNCNKKNPMNLHQFDYEVSARLVEETPELIQQGQQDPASPKLSHPESTQSQSWWLRNRLVIILTSLSLLIIGALVATIGVILGQQKSSGDVESPLVPFTEIDATLEPTSPSIRTRKEPRTTSSTEFMGETTSLHAETVSTKIATTTAVAALSKTTATTTAEPLPCVRFLQTLFNVDCASQCLPIFAMDDDTVIVSVNLGWVKFFSIKGDSFELVTTYKMKKMSYFLHDIAIYGDVVAITAPEEGAVYVLERSSSGKWKQTMQIVDNIGTSVSVYDDLLVTGGNVYRRSGSSWTFETALVKSGGETAVSVVGNMVAVGDKSKEQVLIFYFDAPTMSWKQFGDPIENNDCESWFGVEVVLTHDKGLLVGCLAESESRAGAVYYYEHLGTDRNIIFKQKIMSSDTAGGSGFGAGLNRIDVVGDVMAVGNYNASNGKAFIFKKVMGVWKDIAKLNSESGKLFGFRVAISQNKILVYSWSNVYAYELNLEHCWF